MKLPFKMTNRIRGLLTVLCLAAAWVIATPTETWRYRMTVTLETPDGPKTGSAVREVRRHKGLGLTGLPPTTDVTGEAVAIDIGGGKYVFALLQNDAYGLDYAAEVMLESFPADKKEGAVTLPEKHYPALVQLDNPGSPKSVARAQTPVREIKIEITPDPVTWQLRKLLPWLPEHAQKRLDGDRFTEEKSLYPFANTISGRAFSSVPAHE